MDWLYRSELFTQPGGFTIGIEGPACDRQGNLYAVNFERQGTIGRVTPEGVASVFLILPGKSVGNGIRFNSRGDMLIADYTCHNIWQIDMGTREAKVLVHEERMNQPNDICITTDDVIFASDPNWETLTGNLWRITPEGKIDLLERDMGTTNGIEVSPDEKTLYVNESRQRRIFAYDLLPNRSLANKRLFYQFEDYSLDGMRCDQNGVLYVTRYDKGTVLLLSPEGKALTEIYLRAKKCSNLAFGGADGRTLYVTMADSGNVESFRTQTPGRAFELRRACRETSA